VALLPLSVSAFALAAAILLIGTIIDLRIGLILTLVTAPLNVLLQTETQVPLHQIPLILTLAIWLAREITLRRRLEIAWTPLYLPIGLFTLAASLSLWVSLSPIGTLTELLKWVEMLVMIAFTLAIGREYGEDWIVGGLVLSAVVQAIIGIYQFDGGSGAPHLWILDFQHFRAFGTFGQPNPFGAFMGLILTLALGAAYGAANDLWRIGLPQITLLGRVICLSPRATDDIDRGALMISGLRCVLFGVSTLIIAVGLYVSWSRGAWIGFLAALAVMVLFAPRRRWIGLALIGVIGGSGLLFVISGLAPASVVNRISDFTTEFTGFGDVRGQVITDPNYAVLERLAHWQAAIGMATDHPFLGVGFGDYEIAYPQYQLMNWPFALGHAHNYYLNLWAETGIVGLVAYLLTWIAIAWMNIRLLGQTSGFQRGIALGLLGTWTHLAVHSIFDKLYVNNLYLHLGVMLGLIALLRISRKSVVEERV
jgi:O-antigen ligase